ncbi:MAG: hypothetical protein VX276_09255, partial [Pseudomonadota bacterium]|nr:hypothetical protein [Pseudomonadota bacterium]
INERSLNDLVSVAWSSSLIDSVSSNSSVTHTGCRENIRQSKGGKWLYHVAIMYVSTTTNQAVSG